MTYVIQGFVDSFQNIFIGTPGPIEKFRLYFHLGFVYYCFMKGTFDVC